MHLLRVQDLARLCNDAALRLVHIHVHAWAWAWVRVGSGVRLSFGHSFGPGRETFCLFGLVFAFVPAEVLIGESRNRGRWFLLVWLQSSLGLSSPFLSFPFPSFLSSRLLSSPDKWKSKSSR